VSIHYLRKF